MLVDLFQKVDFYFPYSGHLVIDTVKNILSILLLTSWTKRGPFIEKVNLYCKSGPFIVKSGPFSIK